MKLCLELGKICFHCVGREHEWQLVVTKLLGHLRFSTQRGFIISSNLESRQAALARNWS
jgi:hypothetical protein